MTERGTEFADQARACLKNGQIAEAIEFARQAVELGPDDADALTILGAALSRADMPDEASDALEKAIRAEPNAPKRRYNLAAHLYRFGWKDEARVELAAALSIAPDYGKAKDLMRRIEQDRWNPPALRYQTPDPTLPAEAPPVQSHTGGFYTPSAASRRRHGIAFIEHLGIVWDVILVGLFVIQVTLMIVGITELVSSGLQAAYDSFTGASAYTGTWLLFVVAWILDLVDRRPSGTYVAMGVLAMLLSAPVCLLAFVPILGAIMFVAYMVGTRKE